MSSNHSPVVFARDHWRTSLSQRMQQRQAEGLVRQRLLREGLCTPVQQLDGQQLVSFCSNDYLGMAAHPEVIAAFQAAAREYGVGSGASDMVTGHCRIHRELEEALADFTGRDKALLFSTGYMANMGVINALADERTLILQDALNHASLLDGGWLSRGRSVRFPHADLQALEQQLQATDAPCLIVSDGVFSMDGDVAPMQGLIALAHKYQAGLMIDDAHGIGCLGEHGRGVIELGADSGFIDQHDLPVLVGTFGKALGTAGAFVAGDSDLIDYIEQFARTHIFTTAMPPALAAATLRSLELVQSESWRRTHLQSLIRRFRQGTEDIGLQLLPSDSAVQAFVIGEVEKTMTASRYLRVRGFQVSAIRPPTVPAGTARLRFTLSAAHTEQQLEQLLEAVAAMAEDLDLSK
ncbi:MAG TPA: 8-amino-7-oxononanoate synthase [Pseudohongiella sp.]|nr:8-amino-7-oxononanoate synthase [Pseudohongiella sp.]